MSFYPVHPVRFGAHWNSGAYEGIASDSKPKDFWAPDEVEYYRDFRAALGSPSAAIGALNINHRISKSYAHTESRLRTTLLPSNLGIHTPSRFAMGSGTPRRPWNKSNDLLHVVTNDNEPQSKLQRARKTLKRSMLKKMGTGKLKEAARLRMYNRVKMLGFMDENGGTNRIPMPNAATSLSPEQIKALKRDKVQVGSSPLKQDQTITLMEGAKREKEQEEQDYREWGVLPGEQRLENDYGEERNGWQLCPGEDIETTMWTLQHDLESVGKGETRELMEDSGEGQEWDIRGRRGSCNHSHLGTTARERIY